LGVLVIFCVFVGDFSRFWEFLGVFGALFGFFVGSNIILGDAVGGD